MAYPNEGEEQTCPECGGPLTATCEVMAPLKSDGSIGDIDCGKWLEVLEVNCENEECSWGGSGR